MRGNHPVRVVALTGKRFFESASDSQAKTQAHASITRGQPAHCDKQCSRQRCENEYEPETDALQEGLICVSVSRYGREHVPGERQLMRIDVRQIGIESRRTEGTKQIELALRFEGAT